MLVLIYAHEPDLYQYNYILSRDILSSVRKVQVFSRLVEYWHKRLIIRSQEMFELAHMSNRSQHQWHLEI